MRHAFRLTAVLLLALSLIAPAVTTAQTTARQPLNAADWATFNPAERQAAIAYQYQLLVQGVAARTIKTTTVMAPLTATATASAACGFTVRNVTAGRWIAGGGWTDATNYMAIIYASKSDKQGQLFRDGQVIKNWYQYLTNATHAEAWTGEDFSYSFEHPTYVVKGWHGAKTSGGAWLLGPDAFCTTSYTP